MPGNACECRLRASAVAVPAMPSASWPAPARRWYRDPGDGPTQGCRAGAPRSEEHTSELQSLMRISYAVFCLKKKKSKLKNTPHQVNQNTYAFICITPRPQRIINNTLI